MPVERLSRTEGVKSCLDSYLLLEKKFIAPPQIQLELISRVPPGIDEVSVRDIVITTAVQCYASGVAKLKPRPDERSISIAESTLKAGHHTTRQHATYTWKLEGVSRSLVHDVLHANPFYNSEQQSQRYVEAMQGNYLVPAGLSEKQGKIFSESGDFANTAYFRLLEMLEPEVERRISQMYPKGGWKVERTEERLTSKIKKLSQEVARYVLPIAQKTTLDHTLSELQLLRLFRASQMPHFSDEARFVIGKMVQEVAEQDGSILEELDIPLPVQEESLFHEEYITQQKAEFDQALGNNQSILSAIPDNSRRVLSASVHNILGLPSSQLTESDSLAHLMDPSKNQSLVDIYEIGIMDPLTSTLRVVSVSYATRLSHTADSQRQRHRRTPGATPPLEAIYDGIPDYMTPLVIRESSQLFATYCEFMTTIYCNIEKAIEAGIPREHALLLLPNAQNVRVVESGDLFDWIHRWKQRLCYLAQEEIFFISVEQVKQLRDTFPEAERILLAPCGIRQTAGIKPRCPEEDRWCGRPVYNWDIDNYPHNRLI